MVTLRRRSSRLRGSREVCPPARTPAGPTSEGLDTLVEREETPDEPSNSLNAIMSATPSSKLMPGTFLTDHDTVKTPKSVQQPRPAHAQMHPEHAHQSTRKMSNSFDKPAFDNVNSYQSSPLRPSHQSRNLSPLPVTQHHMRSSPGFEFNFTHNRSDLSEEAQRIMASVREEATRIKEQMRLRRQEQARNDQDAEDEAGISHRRFAKPKTRFSDVHKAEFSKMKSIADYPSLKKNKDQSAGETGKIEPPTGLKRSHSKIDLKPGRKGGLKRTQSKVDILVKIPAERPQGNVSQRLEDICPAKRRRMIVAQDVSALRPGSSDTTTSSIPSPNKPSLPSAVTTPTKASLARARSVHDTKDSKLPMVSLPRSKSLRDIAKPGGLRTASGRFATAVANKVNNMRSILHKPPPKYSDDPVKIAAGTHIPMPKPTPSAHQGTPSMPNTPRPQHTLPRPTPKRVEFALDTKAAPGNIISASPKKSLHVPSPSDSLSPQRPSLLEFNESTPVVARISYPSLSPSPEKSSFIPLNRTKSQRPQFPSNPLFSHPPNAADFTFAHEKRILFSPQRPTLTSSEATTPTSASIRCVRPSGMPTPIMSSTLATGPSVPRSILGIPHGMANKKRAHAGGDSSDMEGTNSLATPHGVPHGLANKKRAHAGGDSSDVENHDPEDFVVNTKGDGDMEEGSPKKRAKLGAASVVRGNGNSPVKEVSQNARRQTGMGGAGHKKGGLSLARINFLARPKERR